MEITGRKTSLLEWQICCLLIRLGIRFVSGVGGVMKQRFTRSLALAVAIGGLLALPATAAAQRTSNGNSTGESTSRGGDSGGGAVSRGGGGESSGSSSSSSGGMSSGSSTGSSSVSMPFGGAYEAPRRAS